MQQVVGSCRAAAEVSLGHLAHLEAGGRERLPGLGVHALAVLQRARRVVGDDGPCSLGRGRDVEAREHLAHVPGEARNARRLRRPFRIVAQEKAVSDRGVAEQRHPL